MKVIGIDPGKKGGWAKLAINDEIITTLQNGDIPLRLLTGERLSYNQAQYRDGKLAKSKKCYIKGLLIDVEMIIELLADCDVLILERQQARRNQKGVLTTGINYGMILAAGIMANIQIIEVHANQWTAWMKEIGIEAEGKELAKTFCDNKGLPYNGDGQADAWAISYYGTTLI